MDNMTAILHLKLPLFIIGWTPAMSYMDKDVV